MKVNIVFYIIGLLLAFISKSIFIRILGADINGLNSLYNSLMGLLNVSELGIGIAIGYSLYKPLSENDFSKVKDIMILFKYYYKKIAKIIFVSGIILSIFLPFLIKGQINMKFAYIYYLIYLINCAISYLFTYKQTLIIADQKQYKIAYIVNIIKIIKVLIQCILIYYTKSFFIWLILEFIFNFLGMVLANRKVDLEYNKKLSLYKSKRIKVVKKENKEIGKNIKNLFFHQIAGFVVFQTDTIVISIFSTLKETGIYGNYILIINSLTGLISNALGSIMPSIGNLIAEESKEKSYKTFKILYLFDNLIAIFITIVTYKLINEFIVFWLGKEYLFANYIVVALIINLYIQISRGTVGRFKSGFGIFWDIHAPIIESIVNLVFSVLLTIKFGIIGVFIGTIISNVLIVLVWQPYILFKQGFNEKFIKYLGQTINIYIRNSIIIIFSNYFYNNFIGAIYIDNQFLNLVVHCALISFLLVVLIFVVFFNMKEFRELLAILKNQIVRKMYKNRLREKTEK